MKQVVIENPILNSPFVEPARYFKFSEEGITDEVVEARRVSSYFIPIARPHTLNGEEHNYIPDFVVRVKDGEDDPLNLIIEVTGEQKKDKAAKVSTARTLWVPAVNNRGDFGRWAFLEISDPWDAKNTIRGTLEELGLKEKSQ